MLMLNNYLLHAGEREQVQFCPCGDPNHDQMILCDDQSCKNKWYHYSCVGLKERGA